jgi:3-methyladenine DNA glycosylase/8-oxoguanine DNA glycosylase
MTRRLVPPPRYDLAGSIRMLGVIHRDPTLRVTADHAWWATRTPDGPGTIHLARTGGDLVAEAFGPGRDRLLERADAIAGLRDDVTGFDEKAASHERVARLARQHSGLRFPSTGQVFHHVVPAILSQKVTGKEAYHGYRRMLRHFAEPAPGADFLLLPPEAAAVAATPYWRFHPWGVEQKRADTIRRAAAVAAALERSADAAEVARRLTALPGIGPWTVAEVTRVSHGDADAVSVGDYHIPNTVAFALAGEVRGDDRRMLELLAPFAGHRGRVCALLARAGIGAPRYGPRMPVRSFAHF